MINYRQKQLIRHFLKNISDDPENRNIMKTPNLLSNKEDYELYFKLDKNSKYKDMLHSLINEYLTSLKLKNLSMDAELSYIIQILALINDSINFNSQNSK